MFLVTIYVLLCLQCQVILRASQLQIDFLIDFLLQTD